jgi:8-oxo-dGTP pyrophosphatase MutT (NUDIX family)
VAARPVGAFDLPRLLLVALREVASLLAGRYSRIEGAHGVVADADGRILVIHPIFPPREWNLPGGKVGKHEAPHEAAAREVLEETGIRVQVERCLLVDAHRSRSTDFIFACRPVGGTLAPQPEEITEVRWVTRAEAAALEPKLGQLLAGLPAADQPMRYRGGT